MNVDNYEVVVRAERPKVKIYDNRQNSNTGTIIFDKSDRNTLYCSQLLHNNSDVTFTDVAPTGISRLHTIIEAMELGYTFDYAISSPIRVLCTNSVPIIGYGHSRWIDINA